MESGKIRLGITMGDQNGIGPEVIIKTLADKKILQSCDVLIYGTAKALHFYKKQLKIDGFEFHQLKDGEELNPRMANLKSCGDGSLEIQVGVASKEAGKLALDCIDAALEDLKNGQIDAIVTAPVNKNAIHTAEQAFRGHTGYIARYFGVDDHIMLLTNDSFRVALVTEHVAIKDLPRVLDAQTIFKKIQILYQSLEKDFQQMNPKIAVLGLNPHAGDNNLLGMEETDIIVPAIKMAKDKGMLVFGPYAADGFFGKALFRKFDAVLAMYHDQGLIPFKALSFESGVNFTAGLPVVRTSPDHGTAYDIAGKGEASEGSLREAIFTAMDILRNRKDYAEMMANPLQKSVLKKEDA